MADSDTHGYNSEFTMIPMNWNDRMMTFQVFPIRQVWITFTKVFSFRKVKSPLILLLRL